MSDDGPVFVEIESDALAAMEAAEREQDERLARALARDDAEWIYAE